MFFGRKDSDFQQEIQSHLELETDRLVADGMSPEDARAAAHRQFGNVLAAEECFHERGLRLWLEQLSQDLRYGARSLLHSPAFLATTVLSLSLGIGLIVTLFAAFNAYVLRPFAVREPYTLHRIAWSAPQARSDLFSWADFQDLRSRHDLFDGVIAERTAPADSGGRTLISGFVSDGYFETLGVQLKLGRVPGPDEEAAALSHDAWSRLFGEDPAAIGKAVEFGRRKLTIVGVVRPEFTGLDDSPRDLWVPLALYKQLSQIDLFGPAQPRQLRLVARLRHDITAAQAQFALTPFMSRFASSAVTPVRPEVIQQATPVKLSVELMAALAVPFTAFLLVLLAACANVANMMLARANARVREISVRLSVGASRSRLVRQLLTEGLLISLLAAGLGLAFASVGLPSAVHLFVTALPPSAAAVIRVLPLELDGRVLVFTLIAAFLTTLLFALAPALQAANLPLTHALRGQAGDTRTGSRLRSALVAGQVMTAVVLLVATITLARNGKELGALNFNVDRAAMVTVRPRISQDSLLAGAAAVLEADPHIQAVAAVSIPPLSEAADRVRLWSQRGSWAISAPLTYVSGRYFDALGIPIVRGRTFTSEEDKAEAHVAVLSASAARTLWPKTDPLGQLIHFGNEEEQGTAVVVGIVQDVDSGMIFAGKDAAHVYLPTHASGTRAAVLLARGHSAHDVRPAITQSILQRVHPEPTAFSVISLEESLALQMFPIQMVSGIGSILGFVALALSLSGLYGVLSYALSQRTREIGIRMALGAGSAAVTRLVLAQSVRLVGLGTGVGALLAVAIMKGLSSIVELRGIASLDAASFLVSVLLVFVSALLATLLPVRRALSIDPGRTLRIEG